MSLSKGKSTTFQPSYTTEFIWVKEHPKIRTMAICTWCHKEINIVGMGKTALRSHEKSIKHKLNESNRRKSLPLMMFVKSKEGIAQDSNTEHSTSLLDTTLQQQSASSSVPDTSLQQQPEFSASSSSGTNEQGTTTTAAMAASAPRNQSVMKQFLFSEEVTKSEIFWCLQIVANHLPFRVAARCAKGFATQFPDSKIAAKLKLENVKVGYLVVFGLAPYFARQLDQKINESAHVVLCFDESLNKVSQRLQMDLHIRWWDLKSNQVKTRYFNSVFLGHSTAADLLEAIKSAVPIEIRNKIIQVSMDGPNVNWKMYKDLEEELKSSPQSPTLLNIGSCGLHTLHGAFKTGMLATKWDIVVFLRALYNLFKDSPARRADFTRYTNQNTFPLKFCAVRWVESGRVADRAVELLPNVKKYVEGVIKDKKEPDCNSFKVVKNCMSDKLLFAKLSFFSSVTGLFEPLLRGFQDDAPLAPFLFSEINSLVLSLAEKVVKKDHLDTVRKCIGKVDLSLNNLIPAKQLDPGFATKDALKHCAPTTDLEKISFFQDIRTGLLAMIKKIIEKSPIKYKLSHSITCLDPKVIKDQRGEKQLTACLEELVGKKWMSGIKADFVKREYRDLFSREHILNRCRNFSRKEKRLDDFFSEIINEEGPEDFKNLNSVIQFLLILSHGNASVERGFSINKECIVQNLQEDSLVALRKVVDSVKDAGGVECVEITKELIHSAKNAHSRYTENLAKKRRELRDQLSQEEERKNAEKEKKKLEAERLELLSEARKRATALDERIHELSKKAKK